MSVSLKLQRGGTPSKPIYKIVAATRGTKRDGKFLDVLGQYNPNTNPYTFSLKEDKVKKWLDVGAQPTLLVKNLIKKQMPGVIEQKADHKRKKIVAARKARKARAAKTTKKSK